jgi:hypothetical protein
VGRTERGWWEWRRTRTEPTRSRSRSVPCVCQLPVGWHTQAELLRLYKTLELGRGAVAAHWTGRAHLWGAIDEPSP